MTEPSRQEPGYLGTSKCHANGLEVGWRLRSDAVGCHLHVLLYLSRGSIGSRRGGIRPTGCQAARREGLVVMLW